MIDDRKTYRCMLCRGTGYLQESPLLGFCKTCNGAGVTFKDGNFVPWAPVKGEEDS